MTYEKMTEKHLPQVKLLQDEWHAEDITYGFAAGTHEQILEAMTDYCFVAVDDNNVVGYLVAEL